MPKNKHTLEKMNTILLSRKKQHHKNLLKKKSNVSEFYNKICKPCLSFINYTFLISRIMALNNFLVPESTKHVIIK